MLSIDSVCVVVSGSERVPGSELKVGYATLEKSYHDKYHDKEQTRTEQVM